MARKYLFCSLISALLILAQSSLCYAGDGHPETVMHIRNYKQLAFMLTDSVPEIKKIPETKTDSISNASAIKEVPKSKKQAVPVAVPITVNIKPIKIIKPKIIKPVIKIK